MHHCNRLFLLALLPTLTFADDMREQENALVENPLKEAYFGETHVHTSYSLDAYIGGARITPGGAYRFAKGESMLVNGVKHNIGVPLDFAAVTDHAEYIGEMQAAQVTGTPGYDHEKLVELRGLTSYEERERWFLKEVIANARGGAPKHTAFFPGVESVRSAWQVMIDAAEENYEPGRFSTLIAFEWSTATPTGGNMHRNVLFRDTVVPSKPISSIDTTNEEELWAWMQAQEIAGSSLLAIPHNSNASKGAMFEPVNNAGVPISPNYARIRSHFEPLIEMMQIKGNSEVHRKFWPADEFADFENADSIQNNSGRTFAKANFVRAALIEGLVHEAKIKANPFKLGFAGGTDSHNGTPGDVVESNYIGSHGAADGTAEMRQTGEIPGWILARDASTGSLTGVYATRNTRGAIFDALRARETFATSGTRIRPRFFAGAGLPKVKDGVALVEQGYARGEPMGATLEGLRRSPTFYVHALKDPDGANLDRIQIIKGWVSPEGEPMERIFDVAVSDGRTINEEGRCTTAVGNTVDLKTAAYRNSIGAVELMATWTDPEFDPKMPALYYTRTLEIPTPRWTTYDAVQHGLPLPEGIAPTIQERAWTSPIWYSPAD